MSRTTGLNRTLSYTAALLAGALLFASPARGEEAPAAEDRSPPVIDHRPVTGSPPGEGITISATITDPSGVALPRLYFRRPGQPKYSAVTMIAAGSRDRYVGTIPSMMVTEAGVEYYIETFDTQGNGPAQHGSAKAPHRITVARPAKDKPVAAPSTPWYKTWWFWTGVGVVVAGSVTAAVVATTGGGDDGSGHTLVVDAPPPSPTYQ